MVHMSRIKYMNWAMWSIISCLYMMRLKVWSFSSISIYPPRHMQNPLTLFSTSNPPSASFWITLPLMACFLVGSRSFTAGLRMGDGGEFLAKIEVLSGCVNFKSRVKYMIMVLLFKVFIISGIVEHFCYCVNVTV